MRLSILFYLLLMATLCSGQLSNELDYLGFQRVTEPNVDEYISNASLSRSDLVNGRYYKVLQFEHILTKAERQQLKDQGLRVLDYVPNKAYLVSIPQRFDPLKMKAMDVRYVHDIDNIAKIDSDLMEDELPDYAKASGDRVKVLISYPSDLKQDRVFELCNLDGIEPIQYNGINTCFTAEIELAKLYEFAQLPYIMNIEMTTPPPVPDDTPGRSLIRANLLDSKAPGGRQYTGEGVAVLCRDDGAVFEHVDFHGRLFQDYDEPDPRTHGDGVSGIMAGAGNRIPKNRGMATGADLHVINYVPSFLDNTLALHRGDDNILVTNSSYSDGCNGGYTATTRTVDDQCYDNPTLMHVFSAGNSNGANCGYGAGDEWGNITGGHKQGKNVLAVANTTNRGVITFSSSRGPAYDGRIKPDISANGVDHISTDNDHDYMFFGGTSAAAPNIAGVMAMLHDAYRQNNAGNTAEAALIKAIMLNTADDIGNKGPDFIYGWGMANAFRSALAIEEDRHFGGIIEQGDELEHTITLPENASELRIMTYWRDPAALIGSTTALTNDLNTFVVSPGGETTLPWILNPSPDPATLARPATRGIDALNNMEQVFIENPEAGDYTLNVIGNRVPTPDHEYIVTWEYRTDDITVVYPTAGDRVYAADNEIIYWETIDNGMPQTISLTTDGGATWVELGTVPANVQNIPFNTPIVNTGSAQVRIERGNQTIVGEPFTIAQIPTSVRIRQVCVDDMVISWSPVDGAESYDVYTLGEKYMEVSATTNTTSATVPINNPFEVQWVAVSANFENDVKGQRTVARSTRGIGLEDCIIDNDLNLASVLNPVNESLVTCSPGDNIISLEVTNGGVNPFQNISASYQINDNPIVTQDFGVGVEAGDTLILSFDEPVSFDSNGEFQLRTWITNNNQEFFLNDTMLIQGPVYVDNGLELPHSEDFDQETLPEFWITQNDDGDITWLPIEIARERNFSEGVVFITFENYFNEGEVDYLYMVPLDLSAVSDTPVLEFEHAYFYDQVSNDGLMIEVSTDCGETFQDTIYSSFGAELGTTFTPIGNVHGRNDWTKEQVDLSPYVGMDQVIIRFVAVNDNGNDLFLDNINVQSIQTAQPDAFFLTGGEETCPLEGIIIEDFSEGGLLTYEWDFGVGALPPTSVHPGPHEVQYLFSGTKTVTLTVTNDMGTAVFAGEIEVLERPSGNWTAEQLGDRRVQFTANINLATNFFWQFGDGDISFEENPIHQYATQDEFRVRLVASNDCGENISENSVTVSTTSTNELETKLAASIVPNPNSGQFVLNVEGPARNELNVSVLNISGQQVQNRTIQLTGKKQTVDFQSGNLDAGIYFVELTNQLGVKTLKMVVVD